MKRLSVLVSCAFLGVAPAACGPGTNPEPALRTEEAPAIDLENLTLSVAGHAELFPEALPLLAARGEPAPALQGLSLHIEEPLRVMLRDTSARLGTGTVAEDGAFRVDDVPVRDIHLGLGAGFEQEGFARTTTVLFDTAVPNTRPRTDLVAARAWAVPLALHDALSRAVGEPRLRALSQGRAGTLLESGFVLGRVVDAQGRPVPGARLQPDRPAVTGHVFYPSPDLSTAGEEATSASGLFLVVGTAGEAEAFRLSVEGQETYMEHNAATAPGVGLVMTLGPGRFQP
ncbi:carboxypeptidase regulatory-like domain-containing protein [Myxococcaceae bacterium GXIMD 01537]